MQSVLIEKRLTTQYVHKAILGLVLTDGHIDRNGRMEVYSSKRPFAEHVCRILSHITGANPTLAEKHDRRFDVTGYRVLTKNGAYFHALRSRVYAEGEKHLTPYLIRRIDPIALTFMWMADGTLIHHKNLRRNKVKNEGWFCLERYPASELQLLAEHMGRKWNIHPSLRKVAWGKGHRLCIGGFDLQRLVSVVYPHILDVFAYKTVLYYKSFDPSHVDLSLPSAERFLHQYAGIEDIVCASGNRG